MKSDYKIQCPKCYDIFLVEVDTTINTNFYPTICPSCGKRIKVKLVESEEDFCKPVFITRGKTIGRSKSAQEGIPKYLVKPIEMPREKTKEKRIEKPMEKPLDKTMDKTREKSEIKTKSKSKPFYPIFKSKKTRLKEIQLLDNEEYHSKVIRPRHSKTPSAISAVEDTDADPAADFPEDSGTEPKDNGIVISDFSADKRFIRPSPMGESKEVSLKKDFEHARGSGDLILPKDVYFTPERRLRLAQILLIIVFILGLANGMNSLVHGTAEQISSDIEGTNTVDIHGKIIDYYSGTPIKNCKITILDTGQSTITDSNGQYFISNIDVGDHEIKAEANGYTNIIKKVTVDPELLGSIYFELKTGTGTSTVDESKVTVEKGENNLNIFAIIIIIISFFALLAILLIHQRNLFKICAFSAFLSILSFGFVLGMFLGLAAFILILSSSASFKTANATMVVD